MNSQYYIVKRALLSTWGMFDRKVRKNAYRLVGNSVFKRAISGRLVVIEVESGGFLDKVNQIEGPLTDKNVRRIIRGNPDVWGTVPK